MKYLSRKFLITLLLMILSSVLPLVYHKDGVSDTVTLTVLGLMTSIGVAYKIANVAESKKDA